MTLCKIHIQLKVQSYLHQYELPVRGSPITCHPEAVVLIGSEKELLELG